MAQDGVPRRVFLGVVGATGALTSARSLGGCGEDPTPSAEAGAPFEAGMVSEFTAPMWKRFRDQKAIVARDAMGFYAYSAECTHDKCTVNFVPTGETSTTGLTSCPCHSSRFDGNGVVQSGSRATRNLSHYRVTITDGRITVTPASVVAATERVDPNASGDGGTSGDASMSAG